MKHLMHSFAALLLIVMLAAAQALAATENAATENAATAVAVKAAPVGNAIYYAIAAAVGCGCFAAAYAVGKVGAAVMGAAAEKPEILGKAIAFVGLGEGIALFGFLVAIFLFTKI